MTWNEAEVLVESGKTVRRKEWAEGYVLYLRGTQMVLRKVKSDRTASGRKSSNAGHVYNPSDAAMYAKDWELA